MSKLVNSVEIDSRQAGVPVRMKVRVLRGFGDDQRWLAKFNRILVTRQYAALKDQDNPEGADTGVMILVGHPMAKEAFERYIKPVDVQDEDGRTLTTGAELFEAVSAGVIYDGIKGILSAAVITTEEGKGFGSPSTSPVEPAASTGAAATSTGGPDSPSA